MKQIQRGAALLTVLALLCPWTLPAAAAADTVTISNVRDFSGFAEACTRDVWSLGVTVELTADLDLSGADFTPVPIFQGVFHGNGHTISGLAFRNKGSKTGLFRTLTGSAVVEDLTVEGSLAPQGSAGQAGLLAGENYGTVRRCTVQGSVAAQEDVGGLVGLNGEGGSLISCSSAADVTGVTNVGGLAGQNLGAIENCSNTGSINTQADQDTPTSVGGIAGLSRGTIRGCTNAGAVGYQHVGYNMGGIAGLQSGEISDCTNTAPIRGRKDVGGIAGQFEPSISLTYGASPADRLNDSLSLLFDQMSGFVDQVSSITDRSLADAQVIEDTMGQIQDRTHDAGTEGHQDFQAMSDQLYSLTQDISGTLDRLRRNADGFQSTVNGDLSTLLEETDRFRAALDDMLSGADSGLSQAVEAMDDTASEIHRQGTVIQNSLARMDQELQNLQSYVQNVARLMAQGDFIGALELPVPSLDPRGHLTDIGNAAAAIFRLTNDLTSQWADISGSASHRLDDARDRADRAAGNLYDAADHLLAAADRFSGQVSGDLDTVGAGSDQIRALLKDYTDALGDKAQSAADDIDAQLTIIRDQVDRMTRAAGTDSDALRTSANQVIASLDQVRQAIYGLDQEPELTVTDLAGEVTEGPGLIRGCTVTAAVEGDSNTGGIVGTVSTELGTDPEETFSMDDLELLADAYATLRAVMRDCRFDGTVTVKNDCGGGVAGLCEAGAILDCAARGTVETGGDYCGGIAGRTRGKVMRCAALVDLTGQNWLGGAAGLGEDITDCRTMVRAGGDGEYRGAIAGQAEGTLTGNRYLMEDLAGLDGVDYQDSAQGLDFASFSQLDYIPGDFLRFSYRFEANGQTVAEIPFDYGSDLDLSQVPQAPRQDGQYGQWPQFPTRNLRRSMVLQAQFITPDSTLADREGVAQLLVEGLFSPDAALTVHQEDLPASSIGGCTVHSAWSYTVTGSQSDDLTVRLRAEGVKHPAAAVYRDGGWERVDSTLDGSYLVFSGPAQAEVLLLETATPVIWIVLPAAGAAAVILAAVLLIRRRNHNRSQAEDPAARPA